MTRPKGRAAACRGGGISVMPPPSLYRPDVENGNGQPVAAVPSRRAIAGHS